MKISRLNFRQVTPDDLTTVSRLGIESKRTWGYDDNQMRVFAVELTLSSDALKALLAAEVACLGEEIRGYYTIRRHSDGVVELEHLFVAPNRFRQGIGSALLHRALATASFRGVPKLVIIADPNSAGFYERYGAQKTGDHKSSIPNRIIPIYEITTNITHA